MEFILNSGDFDFKKTFDSGLFYFFYTASPNRVVCFQGRQIEMRISQKVDKIKVHSLGPKLSREDKKSLRERLCFCFGLNENLDEFYSICKNDRVLSRHLFKIRNTRIISAFSDFEALVGAIVSQNNSYRNYRKKMLKIYETLNFAPENFTRKNLKNLGLGYRVPYLLDLAKNLGRVELQKIHGIGPYSVQLFEIFQKRNYGAFYMDCLTEKIMREQYEITSDFERASSELWGNWRGLAEAYLQRFFEIK